MADTDSQPFRELTSDEQDLLHGATFTIRLLGRSGPDPRWPVWDFVAHTFIRETDGTSSPEELLAGLPAGRSIDGRGPYRLYWLIDAQSPGVPNDDTTFGLTIAGLHAIRGLDPRFGELADQIATYIGTLGRESGNLQLKPYEPASWDAPLTTFSIGQFSSGELLPLVVPPRFLADVLKNESAPISVGESSDGTYTCRVRGRALQPFVGVTTAAEYLAIAWREQSIDNSEPVASPLTLIQTIDYFGYVVASTTQWKAAKQKDSPVQVRSLNAAAALGLGAETQEEFESRLSGLCTVIDQFTLPRIPAETLKANYGNNDGSLNRLDWFLSSVVTDEPYRAQVIDAIATLRDVRRLRLAAQHDAEYTRSKAAEARNRFRLTAVPQSWAWDWGVVRSRTAAAFSALIQAIQASA